MVSRKTIGWLELILGVLLVALGVLTMRNPGTALTTLVVVYAIAAIISGVVDIVFYVRLERRAGFAPVMLLISGIVGIAVGVLLFFNINAGVLALSVLFPVWFIMHCFSQLFNLNRVRFFGGRGAYLLSLVVNVLGLILGFILLFNLGLSASALVYIVAIYLLVLGIEAIIRGIGYLSQKNT